ncbi:MAG: class I SAM-dependent methyltransferase [Lachnospiraceae bacterium]|nr:class I SAM-dependent methyltransferase [Lachnospiraceae bacterium]
MNTFKDYALYYNAFYKDKDYANEAHQVDTLLREYAPGKRSLITFGCGTGKHDFELIKLGYHMTGIDISEEMVAQANQFAKGNGIDESFAVADIRNYTPERTYDAVLSLFHVMSYQNSNDDLMKSFKSARKCLDTGGLFLFDAWYGPGVLTDRPSVRVKEAETEKYKLIRYARPVLHDKDSVVDVCYKVLVIDKATDQVQVIEETHNMRYFFKPEIELMLSLSGFELIDVKDCNTLGETSYDSWTSYFIARAV